MYKKLLFRLIVFCFCSPIFAIPSNRRQQNSQIRDNQVGVNLQSFVSRINALNASSIESQEAQLELYLFLLEVLSNQEREQNVQLQPSLHHEIQHRIDR